MIKNLFNRVCFFSLKKRNIINFLEINITEKIFFSTKNSVYKLTAVTFATQSLFLSSDRGHLIKTNFHFGKTNLHFLNGRGHIKAFGHKKSRKNQVPANI